MKTTIIALLAALALAPLPAAAQHEHGAHGHGPAKLQLDHGRKWPTDEPLRQGMAAMRGELAPKLHAIHGGKLSAEDYAALGRTIEGRVGDIVGQCKLAPEADAMLHLVVADLLAAADVMQGKEAGKPAAAARRVVAALNAYGRHFDHPGWQALK